MRRVILIAVIALASCSSQTPDTTLPAPELTTLPPATAPQTSAATTTTTSTTTTTTTTTTTLPPDAAAEFALTQVVFGDGAYAVITNWGNDVGSLAGSWLSQGPKTRALPDIELTPGEQALLGLAVEPPPDLAGIAAKSHLGAALGKIVQDGGELALYKGNPDDAAASLIGYVAWGDGPHPHAQQALDAGIWDEASVEIVDDTPSISTGIYPAQQASDWAVDIGG